MTNWIKYIAPGIGLYGLIGSFWHLHYHIWPVELLDFEGFNFSKFSTIYLSFYFLISGIWYFNKGGFNPTQIKLFKEPIAIRLFHIVALIVIVVMVFFRFIPSKYKLPLKKIQTMEISATLNENLRFNKNNRDLSVGIDYLGLKEYPNITFVFPDERTLKTETFDLGDKNSIQKGTPIKLKIRTAHHKSILEPIENGDHVFFPFYELEIDSKIIVRKFGIK